MQQRSYKKYENIHIYVFIEPTVLIWLNKQIYLLYNPQVANVHNWWSDTPEYFLVIRPTTAHLYLELKIKQTQVSAACLQSLEYAN